MKWIFEVTLNGRELWISVDGELQRVAFRVARVVEADDATAAANRAGWSWWQKGQERANNCPAQTARQDIVVRGWSAGSARRPAVQPGFRFSPTRRRALSGML